MSLNVSEELVSVESRVYAHDSGRVKTGVKLCSLNPIKVWIFSNVPITFVHLIANKIEYFALTIRVVRNMLLMNIPQWTFLAKKSRGTVVNKSDQREDETASRIYFAICHQSLTNILMLGGILNRKYERVSGCLCQASRTQADTLTDQQTKANLPT